MMYSPRLAVPLWYGESPVFVRCADRNAGYEVHGQIQFLTHLLQDHRCLFNSSRASLPSLIARRAPACSARCVGKSSHRSWWNGLTMESIEVRQDDASVLP